VLRLEVRRAAEASLELAWPAVPGRTYALEVSAHPAGPFTAVLDPDLPRRATGPWETWRLPAPSEDGPRFYRLKVLP